MVGTRSVELYVRARKLIPGGVNSPVRAMRAVGLDAPLFMRRGEGAYVEDEDGNRYVDWVLSWGPLLFGHADPEIVAAVVEAAAGGTTFGAPTAREVELAQEIVDAVPSVEMVRLVSSGTEAAMSAVRLARGATRRDRVLKFAGCYHGHVDALLASAGSGLATLGIPTTPGVPTAATADTVVCPYNDVDAAAAAVERYGEGLAAVIVEPVAGNMGVVPPEPGFLEALRALCDACGALLASAGSGVMTLGIPSTPGVPPAVAADTIVVPFNDVDAVAVACERYGEGLAAILVEPVGGNMGCVPPAPGFLEALRELADATGALLVFDEVITGFRLARGGAQELYGVLPDLTVLGKIVGGGLPAAAFGGRAELMERLAPVGDVYQAGTLSGNPLAMAAGASVLRRLRDPGVYEQLERTASALAFGLEPFGTVQRVGAMLTLFCGDEPVRDHEDAAACDTERFAALFRHLLGHGVYVPPSQFECWFVSTAHTRADVDDTIAAARSFFEATG